MRIEDILICPKTKNRISFDPAKSEVKVENTDIAYPVRNGIIDFLPGVDDGITKAYNTRSSIYNAYVTSSNLLARLANLAIWGVGSQYEFAQRILPFIPEDFNGILLDVPVGTGILTLEKYRRLPRATIIAVDYSLGMLSSAQRLYAQHGLKQVTLVRADVGNLPIDDAKVDLCLSMNGFHAFPGKDAALREIRRVLKSRGRFAGCFYIRGRRAFSDFFVQNSLARGGSFTAPFYDEAGALAKLGEYFNIRSTTLLKSFIHFNAEKR
jgi:SAM-dependent methyltransferase